MFTVDDYLSQRRLSSLTTLHGCMPRSLQTVLYDWRLTRRKAEDLIPAGVVAQVSLDVPGWIKFMVTLESLYQRYGPERLPEDMERRDDLRPGDNDDDDDDDDDHDDDDDTGAGDSYFRQVVPCQLVLR